MRWHGHGHRLRYQPPSHLWLLALDSSSWWCSLSSQLAFLVPFCSLKIFMIFVSWEFLFEPSNRVGMMVCMTWKNKALSWHKDTIIYSHTYLMVRVEIFSGVRWNPLQVLAKLFNNLFFRCTEWKEAASNSEF